MANGDDKAIEAVKSAVASPLLETTITGASHVIINISGDISLMDANDAASYVQDLAGDNANIIFGAKFDENMADQAIITVIATGLEDVAAAPKVMPNMKYPQQPATSRLNSSSRATNAMGTAARSTGTMGAATRSTGTMGATARSANPYGTASTTQGSNLGAAPSSTGFQRARRPEAGGSASERDIKIPEFLKNTRR